MFGFFQSTFTAVEQGQGYAISVGYLKRPQTNVVALAFTVNRQLGTASKLQQLMHLHAYIYIILHISFCINLHCVYIYIAIGDFTLQTTAVAVLPNQAERQVTFTFHVDSIAQEEDETVRLRLTASQSVLNRFDGQFNNSVFFLDTADLMIVDGDRK